MKNILLLIFSVLSFSSLFSQIPTSKIDTAKTTQPSKSITIIGVGDIMLGTNYPDLNNLPPNDENILAELSDVLKNADVTFGNLEGTLFDEGGTPKKCNNPATCYVFRTPSKYGKYLAAAGFDVMSIANNHSGDFGEEGRNKTKENLDELGIKYAGLLNTNESVIFEKNGITYGFVAFAPNNGTVNINDISRAKEIVSELDKKVDIVIVSFHGGAEGAKYENVPKKNEIFLKENRGNVYEFSKAVIDAGADLVFGHGPHVTRAFDLYKGKFIAYSLGNFATFGMFNLNGPNGLAPIIKLSVNEKGDFLRGEIIPVFQTKDVAPKIDPENRVIEKIISLTQEDFPESQLNISADGKVTVK